MNLSCRHFSGLSLSRFDLRLDSRGLLDRDRDINIRSLRPPLDVLSMPPTFTLEDFTWDCLDFELLSGFLLSVPLGIAIPASFANALFLSDSEVRFCLFFSSRFCINSFSLRFLSKSNFCDVFLLFFLDDPPPPCFLFLGRLSEFLGFGPEVLGGFLRRLGPWSPSSDSELLELSLCERLLFLDTSSSVSTPDKLGVPSDSLPMVTLKFS